MKKILITIVLITASTFLYSQSMNLNNNKIRIVDSTMGLGISPTSRLHVFGNGTASNLFNVTNDKDATKDSSVVVDAVGNVGIGKEKPTAKLYVQDTLSAFGGSIPVAYIRTAKPNKIALGAVSMSGFNEIHPNYNIGLYASSMGGINNFAGYFNGGDVYINNNLGIGRLAPTYRLDIFGNGCTDNLLKVSNDINSTYDSTFVIKSNGNVGLGNNTALHRLYVEGSGDCHNIYSEYSGSYSRSAIEGRALGSDGYGIRGLAGTIGAKAGSFENYAQGTSLEVIANNGIAINVKSGYVIADSTRFISRSTTLSDNEQYAFPTNLSWKGEIDVDSLGYTLFTAQIRCDADGTPYLEGVSWKRWSSKTYVKVGSTDGYLNITDGGSGMVITNTLGYTIKATLRFRTKQ